jgi:hypothetical protein
VHLHDRERARQRRHLGQLQRQDHRGVVALRRWGRRRVFIQDHHRPSMLGPAPEGASRAAGVTVASLAASPSSTAVAGAGGGGVVGTLVLATTDGASSACNDTVLVLGS